MFFEFSIIHFRESNQILKFFICNYDNLWLQKARVERKKPKTLLILAYQLRIRNPLLKNGFRIRIPKFAQKLGGFRIPDPDSGLPTLEKTQDANFSLPNKNPESAIKKRIPDSDSKIGQKLGGFRIANPNLCISSIHSYFTSV